MTKHIKHLQNLVFMKFKVIFVNLILLIQIIILKNKLIIGCK